MISCTMIVMPLILCYFCWLFLSNLSLCIVTGAYVTSVLKTQLLHGCLYIIVLVVFPAKFLQAISYNIAIIGVFFVIITVTDVE